MSKANQLMEIIEHEITPGLMNAVGKFPRKSGKRCSECQFDFPVYPGQYPKTCPQCGKPIKYNNGEVDMTDQNTVTEKNDPPIPPNPQHDTRIDNDNISTVSEKNDPPVNPNPDDPKLCKSCGAKLNADGECVECDKSKSEALRNRAILSRVIGG